MSFNYMNEQYGLAHFESITGTTVRPFMEVTRPTEITEGHVTMDETVAASTAEYITIGIEDGGAAGTGSTVMLTALHNQSTAFTALTTRDFTVSEGTIDAADAINVNMVETGTVTPIPTIALAMVGGVPAGAG